MRLHAAAGMLDGCSSHYCKFLLQPPPQSFLFFDRVSMEEDMRATRGQRPREARARHWVGSENAIAKHYAKGSR